MLAEEARLDDPEPTSVPYFSVDNVADRMPHAYLGLLMATGASGYEALDALERRALETACREHRQTPVVPGRSVRHTYALIGVRIAGGTASSGQPEWVAYGTLVQVRYEKRLDDRPTG